MKERSVVLEQEHSEDGAGGAIEASTLRLPPLPVPALQMVSGLYALASAPFPVPPLPTTLPTPVLPPVSPRTREELRLDVDGLYAQSVASGSIATLRSRVEWIASIAPSGSNTWRGTIAYKDGDLSLLPYTDVEIQATAGIPPTSRRATVTFSGGGAHALVRAYRYRSPLYRRVEFEFDAAQGATAVTNYPTHSHPNRPAALPNETLTIETVFRRAGFDVRRSGGDSIVPMTGAGGDRRWSDLEMHDAMQANWSRFANVAHWAMWTFFASLSDRGPGLGGIMFDQIGPNHRQGTAIFEDSFIATAPQGDPAAQAWVQRMRFWTACHEMGHCFNLAHSWQKSLGVPWLPLADEPLARSFMNYPYLVPGGHASFFSDFEFRFSDQELLFMRHAPERFVEMGNAAWFDHHGFEQANVSLEPALELEVRVNRDPAVFEFLEPVVLELKLKNVSSQPILVPERVLSNLENMTVVLKRDRQPAREFTPFARFCWQPMLLALMPGEALYESLFVGSGLTGWDVADPGYYTIQVALHPEGEDVVSNRLRLRILPPADREEDVLAQDFFSEEVGRTLTFDGTRVLDKGNETLREVADRLGKRKVAIHVRVALGNALTRDCKQVHYEKGDENGDSALATRKIKIVRANPAEAKKVLSAALTTQPKAAAESLGHVDYKHYVDRFSDWLAEQGATKEAVQAQEGLHDTLSAKKVLDRVLEQIRERRDSYGKRKK